MALLPFDTADFATLRSLALWCMWNSTVTVEIPFAETPENYAVNWLGKRVFRVKPMQVRRRSVPFAPARHDDIFCYEIVPCPWRDPRMSIPILTTAPNPR